MLSLSRSRVRIYILWCSSHCNFRLLSTILSLFQPSEVLQQTIQDSNQPLLNNSSVPGSTTLRIVSKGRKYRRRENMLASRGKLINSLRHGKTPLTRYKNGELFSGQQSSVIATTPPTFTTTTPRPTLSSSQGPQQFANQILGLWQLWICLVP